MEANVQKGGSEVGLFNRGWNIRQVKGRGGWVDIGIVFASWLFETMKIAVGIVFGQACIGLAVFGQLNSGMLRGHYANGLAPQFHFVQMIHGQEGLLGFRHLHQSSVLLVEQDFDPLDVSVHAKEDEEVITFGEVLVEVRHQEDRARASHPEGSVEAEVDSGDGGGSSGQMARKSGSGPCSEAKSSLAKGCTSSTCKVNRVKIKIDNISVIR